MLPEPQSILVPGRGVVNLEAERVNRAVQEYDENLRFGYNPVNEDWIVYVRMPRNFDAYYYIDGDPVYPVIGFQQRVPSTDEALTRVRAADSLKHGMQLLDRMNKENERLREAEDSEFTDDAAERITHELIRKGVVDKKAFYIPDKGD